LLVFFHDAPFWRMELGDPQATPRLTAFRKKSCS